MKKETRQRKRVKAKLSGRDRRRLEWMRELAIASAKLIQLQGQEIDDLRESIEELRVFIVDNDETIAHIQNYIKERLTPRIGGVMTWSEYNMARLANHVSQEGTVEGFRRITWDFIDYLPMLIEVERKVRQIEFAMPYEAKAAMPGLDSGPQEDKPSDPVTELFSLDE